MFGFITQGIKTNKSMWNWAGYYADVMVLYGQRTRINIDKLARSRGESKALDAFVRMAYDKGLAAAACAEILASRGYSDLGVL